MSYEWIRRFGFEEGDVAFQAGVFDTFDRRFLKNFSKNFFCEFLPVGLAHVGQIGVRLEGRP